jgi:hypothetical protein
MQSRRLVGRERELALLTDWVARPASPVYRSPMLSLVAIGGMCKIALTWHFFTRIAAEEMRPPAGRLCWSFYERDAHFEAFVAHALAYCTGQTLGLVGKLDLGTQMDRLWQALNARPFLLVLDGLERILVAYNRLDAPRMRDDELDEETANHIASAHGLPQGAGETYLARHRLRACTDPRAGGSSATSPSSASPASWSAPGSTPPTSRPAPASPCPAAPCTSSRAWPPTRPSTCGGSWG